MHVFVHLEEHSFRIQCGEGSQTVKWLALNASRRYADLFVPKGRVRWSEGSHMNGGSFVPSDLIRMDDGKSVHPDAVIKDTLKNGEHVDLKVRREIKFSKDGYPMPTPWAVQAFSTNADVQRRTKMRINRAIEITKTKEAKEESERVIEAEHIFGSVSSDIATKFHADWKDILKRRSGNASLKSITPDAQMKDVRRSLAQYYDEMFKVFQYFSGGSYGERAFMTFTELSHCMHRMRLVDAEKDRRTLRRVVFKDCGIDERKKSQSPNGTVTRSEFVEIAIRLAVARCASGAAKSPCAAVEGLVHDHILPWMMSQKQNKMFHSLLQPDFEDVVKEYVNDLRSVFYDAIGTRKGDGSSRSKDKKRSGVSAVVESKNKAAWTVHTKGTMSLFRFHRLLLSSRLVSQKVSKYSEKKARRVGRAKGTNAKSRKAARVGGAAEKNETEAASKNIGSTVASKDDGISGLVKSSFLSAVCARPIRAVDFEQEEEDDDEASAFLVLRELTFPEFVEAIFEFATLKIRQEVRAKARKESTETSKNDATKNRSQSPADAKVTEHERVEKFIEVVGAIVKAGRKSRT